MKIGHLTAATAVATLALLVPSGVAAAAPAAMDRAASSVSPADTYLIGYYPSLAMCVAAGASGQRGGQWDTFSCRPEVHGSAVKYALYVTPSPSLADLGEMYKV
jgi:hypothetical protein